MQDPNSDEIRRSVRDTYGKVADSGGAFGCCGTAPSPGSPSSGLEAASTGSCCGPSRAPAPAADEHAVRLGYSATDSAAAPPGADLGLGCGNPQAIASLEPGETVLDLGSGAGFDCFLAARQVGRHGRVIGVDMTPEMIGKARANGAQAGLGNVEFRLGEIEHLPVADGTVDVIISNCVINLSPEKPKVFQEAFRVLKPGGRLAVADVVATADLPETAKRDLALYTGCVSGASRCDEVQTMLEQAGFTAVRVKPKDGSREVIGAWAPGRKIEELIASATIEAVKPRVAATQVVLAQ